VLIALLADPDRSHADLARACKFFFDSGEPAKSRLQRTFKRLEVGPPKLIKPNRGHWALTDEGRKLARKLRGDADDTIEDRGGAVSSKPFVARKGERCRDTVPCAHCLGTGDVYRIGDGRLPKGKAHAEALHERCAADFFTGKPAPESPPEANLL
jgi:hypothetical protein